MAGKIAERSELPVAVVQQCAEWHGKQIRKLPVDLAAELVGGHIEFVARNYGAREKPDPVMYREALALVGNKFAFLAPQEIREAYRMFAAGEIDTPAGEMYGGKFNVRQLGAVLSAYAAHRKYNMAKYLSAMEEAREATEKEERKAKQIEEFEQQFAADLQNGIEAFEDWRDVPEYWYHVLLSRGELEFTKEEALEIFEDAGNLAILEEKSRKDEARETGRLFDYVSDREQIQKVIARKITVFRKYILANRPTTPPPE